MEKAPIYILGLGNLGKLVAHSLRKQFPTAPVTLLLHRESLLSDWAAAGQAVECRSIAGAIDRRSGFAVELLSEERTPSGPPIKHLVVATKTYMTAGALGPIKHRLGRDSNVLFLQNGMGTTDELSATLFPDRHTRPAYWAGICSAGVYATGPFSIVHAGRGPLTIGRVLDGEHGPQDDGAVGMIQRLLEARDLEASLATPDQIRTAQLQKLVVNATINPLTAVFDCLNAQVFASPVRRELLGLLLAETGPVVRALLPASVDDEARRRLSDEQLLASVLLVAEKTAGNVSSMLQDARAGRRTEIDYINGYIVSQARRLRLACARTAKLVEAVKQRRTVTDAEMMSLFTEQAA